MFRLHKANSLRCSLASARQLCSQGLSAGQPVPGVANLRDSLEEKLKVMLQQQQQQHSLSGWRSSIFRVPAKFRKMNPSAYEPQAISIGPYHHGSHNLQEFEGFKWEALNRAVGSGAQARKQLDQLVVNLEDIEPVAREHYSEQVTLSKDEFVKMMLLDGCFIVELFRDLCRNNFRFSTLLPKKWMLPVVRRDLITLENQLPMMALELIFKETMTSTTPIMQEESLYELALRYFDPLMPRHQDLLRITIASISSGATQNCYHLLDFFRDTITPDMKINRGEEPNMHLSVTKLKSMDMKVRVLGHRNPLEVRFEAGVLRISSLKIHKHTGDFFRNILAYEQCQDECYPDMTAYLFFLSKLINSAEDAAILQEEEVIQHYLGSDKQIAKVVDGIGIEFDYDGQDSYLQEVISDLNSVADNWLIKIKLRLEREYFSSVKSYISMLFAILALYLSLLQTCSNVLDRDRESNEFQVDNDNGLWAGLHIFLLDPVEGFKIFKASVVNYLVRVTGETADEDPF